MKFKIKKEILKTYTREQLYLEMTKSKKAVDLAKYYQAMFTAGCIETCLGQVIVGYGYIDGEVIYIIKEK